MIWGILIVLIVVCLGFLAWLFCIAPASPRGDFAEMKDVYKRQARHVFHAHTGFFQNECEAALHSSRSIS